MHAIGRRFESVHLHIKSSLVLALLFGIVSTWAVQPVDPASQAVPVYNQFLQALTDRNFIAAYPLLDEVSHSYIDCSLALLDEIRPLVVEHPDRFPPEHTTTIKLLLSACNSTNLFTIMMERFFPPVSSDEFVRLKCYEITVISPNACRIITASGKDFLVTKQNDGWKVDLSDRFMAFYDEIASLKDELENIISP